MTTPSKSHEDNIADLEEIVRKWAWGGYEMTKTRDQAKIPKEFLNMTTNWKFVRFNFDHPQYSIVPMQGGSSESGKGNPQVLFRTYFTNHTNQDQEYSFKTERTTRSACTVAVEKGFSAGGEFSLKLQTPCEVMEANAGFKREICVVNIGEDTVEEELTWGVDSAVRVPPQTVTDAELVITEAACNGAFHMTARISGRVIVSFNNMKENNSLVTVIEGDISEIILREIEKGSKIFRVERNRVVVADIKGKCKFKYGVEQHVRLVERKISASNGSSSHLRHQPFNNY